MQSPMQKVSFFCACIVVLIVIIAVSLAGMSLRVEELEKSIRDEL